MLKFKTSCAVLVYLSSNLLNEVGLSLFRYFVVGLRVWDIIVKKFTFAISSPDEFLYDVLTTPFYTLTSHFRYYTFYSNGFATASRFHRIWIQIRIRYSNALFSLNLKRDSVWIRNVSAAPCQSLVSAVSTTSLERVNNWIIAINRTSRLVYNYVKKTTKKQEVIH